MCNVSANVYSFLATACVHDNVYLSASKLQVQGILLVVSFMWPYLSSYAQFAALVVHPS